MHRWIEWRSALILGQSLCFLMLTPLFLGWDTTHKHEMIFPRLCILFHSSPLHRTPHEGELSPGISCIPITYAVMLCKFHYLAMLASSQCLSEIFGRMHGPLCWSHSKSICIYSKTVAAISQPSDDTLFVLILALTLFWCCFPLILTS